MPEKLITFEEIAERLGGVAKSTLYEILARIDAANPDNPLGHRIGRHRRFSEEDYRRILEVTRCRPKSPHGVSAAGTEPDGRSANAALMAMRRRRTRPLLRKLRSTM